MISQNHNKHSQSKDHQPLREKHEMVGTSYVRRFDFPVIIPDIGLFMKSSEVPGVTGQSKMKGACTGSLAVGGIRAGMAFPVPKEQELGLAWRFLSRRNTLKA